MIEKKTIMLIALGVAATLAIQNHGSIQSWLRGKPAITEPARRIETLDLPEPQEAPRPTRYGRTVPQDISVRVRSVAAEARDHIARTGQAVTNFYIGGNSVTPVDADEHDRSRYTSDVGNILWRETHE